MNWTVVSPWWSPGQSSGALFRAGDSSFVGNSEIVAPGRYYLVTSSPESVPSDFVLEDAVYLESEDADAQGTYYSILFVDLPAGSEISEPAIRVRGVVQPPSLEFVNARQLKPPVGKNVFVGRLPSLRLLNWTAECSNKYWVWISDFAGERRLNPTLDGRLQEVHGTCPNQGSIWIEAKNYIRDASRNQRVTFAVIPDGIDLQIVEQSSALGESAHLQARMPHGWVFQPSPPLLRDNSGLWKIPSGERIAEGLLCSGEFRLPISLRVNRIAIHFQASRGSGRVVWQEDPSEDLEVLIEGPPNARCLILLEGDGASILVSELGDLDKSGVKRILFRQFRDSIALCQLPAAEFRVQVGNHISVPTGHYFASAKKISQCLPTESKSAMLFRLPDIGPALSRARDIVDAPPAAFFDRSKVDVPDSLASFLSGIAYGAGSLDNAKLLEEAEEYRKMAPTSICAVVDWLKCVQASATVLGGEQALLDGYPSEAESHLPVHRWQQALRQTKCRLETNRDLPKLIREWHLAIQCPDKERDSELHNRIGGSDLTNAVRMYNDSFAVSGKAQNQILTRSIIVLRRVSDLPNADVIVKMLVPPFLQLAFYRSDRKQDAAAVRVPFFPVVFAQLGNAMNALAAQCRSEIHHDYPIEGEGFALISTRDEDAQLDSEIGEIVCLAIST
jgi:hypothetical protein